MQWYYQTANGVEGPLDDEAMRQVVRDGKLARQDLVRNDRMGDQWAPLSQFLSLVALLPAARQADPVRPVDLTRQLAATEQLQYRQRTMAWCVVAAVVLVIVAVVGAIVQMRRTAPYRAIGISAAYPIGSFERLDRQLTQELQMDRHAATNCPVSARTAPTLYVYDHPKAPRGRQVSAGGSITLLVDADRVTGICVMFPSSGPRKGTFYNLSVCGLWGTQLWRLLGAAEDPFRQALAKWPAGTWEDTGLSDSLPRDGSLAIHDGAGIRGCWYEYTPYGMQSVIFLEPKVPLTPSAAAP